jgi:hypothetical protein
MSPTDSIQDLFDRALSSVPTGGASSAQSLHERFRRRRLRIRLSTMGSSALAIVVIAVVLVAGPSSKPAYAVTLYPGSAGSVAAAQLPADQRVMTARLRAIGYPDATVEVTNGALVVTNGPKDLADPSSLLTSSPELLIRQVRCSSGVASGPRSTEQLPATCSKPKYEAPTSTPDGTSSGSGFTVPPFPTDPALSSYATTTPSQDASSPNAPALLPILNSGTDATQRFLVGPTLLTLSSRVASAKVTRAAIAGGWLIDVRLNRGESILWDRVAKTYFHRQLAIDLNGVIVEAPIIQPANTRFSSFDGHMELFATSKSGAYDLAAALTSGPLAVPLTDRPGTNYFPPDHDLQFVSSDVGWIVANDNSILGTTDGGRHWSTMYRGSVTNINDGDIESIDFVNPSDGWALKRYEGLISTRDGGHSWSSAREPSQGAVINYDFVTADLGWALTSNGVLLRTLDAGRTWTKFPAPALGTSLCATPSGTLWLGIDGSGSLYLLNGGKWTLSLPGSEAPAPENSVPPQPPRPAPWISCAGSTAWLFYGYGEGAGSMPYAVERTVNVGRTWNVVTSSQVTPSVPSNTPGRFATIDDFGMMVSGDAWMTGYCGPCDTGKAEVAIATKASPFRDLSLSNSLRVHAVPIGSSFINSMDGWVNLQENQVTVDGNLVPNTSVKYVIEVTINGGRTWRVVDPDFEE